MLGPRLRVILLLLGLCPGIAQADWTGISLNFANNSSDWNFRGETREAKNSEISFRIEERTDSGLSVGAAIGYFDLRVAGDSAADTVKFDGQYFGIYLRQEFDITGHLSLHGNFGFKYSSGNESGDEEIEADIGWTETDLELGLGFRAANLRIIPFAAWSYVDGDISDEGGTSVFDVEQADYQGIRFDLYVEQTAFVRLEFTGGGRSGGSLLFVRRY